MATRYRKRHISQERRHSFRREGTSRQKQVHFPDGEDAPIAAQALLRTKKALCRPVPVITSANNTLITTHFRLARIEHALCTNRKARFILEKHPPRPGKVHFPWNNVPGRPYHNAIIGQVQNTPKP